MFHRRASRGCREAPEPPRRRRNTAPKAAHFPPLQPWLPVAAVTKCLLCISSCVGDTPGIQQLPGCEGSVWVPAAMGVAQAADGSTADAGRYIRG